MFFRRPTETPLAERPYGAWYDPLVAVASSFAAYALLRHHAFSTTELAMLIVLAVAGALAIIEYARVNRDTERPAQPLRDIVALAVRQWLNAMVGLALVLAFWWLLVGEYGRPEYNPLWNALSITLLFIPPIMFVSEVFAAWRLGAQRFSEPVLFNALVMRKSCDRQALGQAVLVLLVRAIFLPINFCVLVQCIGQLRGREVQLLFSSTSQPYEGILLVIYTLLITAIMPGYVFSSRLLATHVRKVDDTLLAWAVTLVCYRPLWLIVFGRWLDYRGAAGAARPEKPWIEITSHWPSLLTTVGMGIILLEVVHLWGEAVFGLRASNLCHRGIITHGPYRYSKHPIYLVKCVGWLLIFMPFAAGSVANSLRTTLLFAGVCGIYAVRAYCEERLLASDPQYVAYASWMDEHGLLSPLGKVVPWLRFNYRREQWALGETAPRGPPRTDD